ncbi:cation:proton antiporter, partial [Serratia marcescens]
FQDFRTSLRQIRRLGIGLVIITALVVGGIANILIGEIGLLAALLLGAIVAPPDAVSATAIGKKLGLPRRVMTVLSGESLINDAAALTMFTLF